MPGEQRSVMSFSSVGCSKMRPTRVVSELKLSIAQPFG